MSEILFMTLGQNENVTLLSRIIKDTIKVECVKQLVNGKPSLITPLVILGVFPCNNIMMISDTRIS